MRSQLRPYRGSALAVSAAAGGQPAARRWGRDGAAPAGPWFEPAASPGTAQHPGGSDSP